MPPKKKVAAPIDRPLSRAYLREFTGWSTAFAPGLSEPTSLRQMENVLINRDGSLRVRPGLRYLSYETYPGEGVASVGFELPIVGSHEAFYLNTGEKAYRIDRYLSQLHLAGLLDRFAGVVVGTFDGADPAELEAVIREYFGRGKVPVLVDFPVGHTAFNATLPHGGRVEIDAEAGTVRLVEPPVRLK